MWHHLDANQRPFVIILYDFRHLLIFGLLGPSTARPYWSLRSSSKCVSKSQWNSLVKWVKIPSDGEYRIKNGGPVTNALRMLPNNILNSATVESGLSTTFGQKMSNLFDLSVHWASVAFDIQRHFPF